MGLLLSLLDEPGNMATYDLYAFYIFHYRGSSQLSRFGPGIPGQADYHHAKR